MSNDLNNCMFIGHLGADPETRQTANSTVANFRIAVGQQWKDASGTKQEKTEWVGIVAWGKLGEICGQYLKKGAQVFVSGRMQTREWEKDGVKRYTTEIIADKVQMLGKKEGGSRGDYAPPPQRQQPAPQTQHHQAKANGYAPPAADGFDDDIPF